MGASSTADTAEGGFMREKKQNKTQRHKCFAFINTQALIKPPSSLLQMKVQKSMQTRTHSNRVNWQGG